MFSQVEDAIGRVERFIPEFFKFIPSEKDSYIMAEFERSLSLRQAKEIVECATLELLAHSRSSDD